MKRNKAIVPIVIGALTVGVALVNNANASLITGETDGAGFVASEILVDAESNAINEGNGTNTLVEESYFVSLTSGDDGIGFNIQDSFYHSTGEEIDEMHRTAGLFSTWAPSLTFSTFFCDNGVTDQYCLNMLDSGVTISADLFNGTNGEGHNSGLFYDERSDLFSDLFTLNYNLGEWSNEGDSGYVAFAYSDDSNSDLYIWDREDVQYGWLDVTRGSISINNVVLQGASSISVPESSSLMLLGLGLAGFSARRFKNK